MEVIRDYHTFTVKNGSFFEQDLDPNHIDSYLKLATEILKWEWQIEFFKHEWILYV